MLASLQSLHSCQLRATHLLAIPLTLLGLWLFPSAAVYANDCSVNRYYVDQDATGSNNGVDWANANTDLQTALNAAVLCPNVTEIWVAEGLYKPGGLADDTFSIRPGLAVYGGFAGTESAVGERNWVSNVTVLSGDVAGNDLVDANGVTTTTAKIVSPNAFHVVTMDGTTTPIVANTRLDGFTVTAGEARTGFTDQQGGGLYCNGSGAGHECSPTIANITFIGNAATNNGGAMANLGLTSGKSSPALNNVAFIRNMAAVGGAMVNDGKGSGTSSPVLTDVTFTANQAFAAAGAMFNDGTGGTSSPVLNRVVFSNNSATSPAIGSQGGAMINVGAFFGNSSPQLNDVTFIANTARNGGAMVNNCGTPAPGTSSPVLNRVAFIGNTATNGNGGAMLNEGLALTSICRPELTNVVFYNNAAVLNGSAIYNNSFSDQFVPVIINSTFAGNPGVAMVNAINAPIPANFTIANTIFYGNDSQILNLGTTVPIISNSLVQDSGGSGGGWNVGLGMDGGGNLDTNPRFVDGANGNLRLRSDSPAIDVGNNASVPVPALTDIAGAPRIVDGNGDSIPSVDMGAYEFLVHALTVVRLGNGSGTVSSVPAGINCGADCTETLHFGTVATLTATPSSNSDFAGWSGACTGTAACTVTVNAATLVNATFTLKQYSVAASANPAAGGTVAGGGTFTHGDTVSLSATANAAYNFVNWTEGGVEVSTNPNYSFTATGNRTLVANFVAKQHNIAVSALVNTAQAMVGDTITFTYRITNTGNVAFATISATQNRVGAVNDLAGALSPNATRTATVSYVVKQSDLPGPLVVTLVVTATDPSGPVVTANASTTVTVSAPTDLPPSEQPGQPQQRMPLYLPNLHRE